MNDLLFQIVSVLVSGMGVSVGLTDIIRRIIQKGKQSEPDISEKIEKVSTVLSQSSGELANLQKELEGKLEFVNKLNEEANQAQNLLSLSHDQIEAIKTMLNQETQKENKLTFGKVYLSILSSLFSVQLQAILFQNIWYNEKSGVQPHQGCTPQVIFPPAQTAP